MTTMMIVVSVAMAGLVALFGRGVLLARQDWRHACVYRPWAVRVSRRSYHWAVGCFAPVFVFAVLAWCKAWRHWRGEL